MFALHTVDDSPQTHGKKEGSEYVPAFPREMARSLASRACGARTIQEACAILRAEASKLPLGGGWRNGLLRIAKWFLSRKGRAPYRVFILEGNSKLPFATFSALPDVTCPGAGDCLHWCCSFKAWKNPGAYLRQLQNTLLLRFRPSAVRSAFYELPLGWTVRLYVDGDIASVGEVRMWMECVGNRPDLNVYGYSKSWDEFLTYAAEGGAFPSNYVLNLSSGSRHGADTLERMKALSCVRGTFVRVKVDYRPAGTRGNINAEKKYADPEYHRLTREAARAQGIERPFSCPGKCGSCSPRGHVCGSHAFDGINVVIGVH